jgi:uncharacterized membrane protein YqhA
MGYLVANIRLTWKRLQRKRSSLFSKASLIEKSVVIMALGVNFFKHFISITNDGLINLVFYQGCLIITTRAKSPLLVDNTLPEYWTRLQKSKGKHSILYCASDRND